jgi:hypothetical protein
MTALTDALKAAQGGTPAAAPAAAPTGSLTDTLKAANGGAPVVDQSMNAPAAPKNADDELSWYNVFHPKPADLSRPQTWTDWMTKTYSPTAYDVGTSALDDVSMGSADWLQSKATGEDVGKIRARTADAQAAMGPAGPLLNAVTYAVPGGGEAKALNVARALTPGKYLGKAAEVASPYIGKYGAAATEGAIASGASSAGHQLGSDDDLSTIAENVGEDMTKGAVFGVGGQAVGRGLQRVGDTGAVRRVADYVKGNPGRAEDPYFGSIRTASNMGADVGNDLINEIVQRPQGDPMQPGLSSAYTASQQSVEPGPMAKATANAARYGAKMAEVHALGPVGWLMDSPGNWIQRKVENAAVNSNLRARNAAVQGGLDQAAATGPQGPLTYDTRSWPRAWSQFAIGGSRAPLSDDWR